MGYSEMVADLTDPAGQCDLASADIGVGSEESHASHQELISLRFESCTVIKIAL
jgi:hypothetical protein